MKTICYPERAEWPALLARPHLDVASLRATVDEVLQDVKARGDEAVLDYEERFDHVRPASLAVTPGEVEEAVARVPRELKEAMRVAEHNIAAFHAAQRFESRRVETAPGGAVRSRRHGAAVLHGAHAGCARTVGRMSRGGALHASRP